MKYFYLKNQSLLLSIYVNYKSTSFFSDILLNLRLYLYYKRGKKLKCMIVSNTKFCSNIKVLQFKEVCRNYSVLFIIIQVALDKKKKIRLFFISEIMFYFIPRFHGKLCMCESAPQSKSHLQFMTSFHPNYLVSFPLRFSSFNFQTHIHLAKIAINLILPLPKIHHVHEKT